MLMINKWIFDFKWKISWKEKSLVWWPLTSHIPIVWLATLDALCCFVCWTIKQLLTICKWPALNSFFFLLFFARFHEHYKNTDKNVQRLISHRSNIGSFFSFLLPSFVSVSVYFFVLIFAHIRKNAKKETKRNDVMDRVCLF